MSWCCSLKLIFLSMQCVLSLSSFKKFLNSEILPWITAFNSSLVFFAFVFAFRDFYIHIYIYIYIYTHTHTHTHKIHTYYFFIPFNLFSFFFKIKNFPSLPFISIWRHYLLYLFIIIFLIVLMFEFLKFLSSLHFINSFLSF